MQDIESSRDGKEQLVNSPTASWLRGAAIDYCLCFFIIWFTLLRSLWCLQAYKRNADQITLDEQKFIDRRTAKYILNIIVPQTCMSFFRRRKQAIYEGGLWQQKFADETLCQLGSGNSRSAEPRRKFSSIGACNAAGTLLFHVYEIHVKHNVFNINMM